MPNKPKTKNGGIVNVGQTDVDPSGYDAYIKKHSLIKKNSPVEITISPGLKYQFMEELFLARMRKERFMKRWTLILQNLWGPKILKFTAYLEIHNGLYHFHVIGKVQDPEEFDSTVGLLRHYYDCNTVYYDMSGRDDAFRQYRLDYSKKDAAIIKEKIKNISPSAGSKSIPAMFKPIK